MVRDRLQKGQTLLCGGLLTFVCWRGSPPTIVCLWPHVSWNGLGSLKAQSLGGEPAVEVM